MEQNNNLYGAWISKSDFIPVPDRYGHEEKAIEIIKERFGLSDTRENFKGNFSIYKIMFRLGYIRVLYNRDGYSVQYYCKAKLTKFQKSIIEDSNYVDADTIYYWQ